MPGLMDFAQSGDDLLNGTLPGVGMIPQAQAPMPGPQASTLPTPQPQQRPNLLQRVGHALSAAEGGVSNAFRPATPAGYDGLLTPDEIASARPSLLHSLIGGPNALSSDHQYVQNLNDIVARKQASVGIQRQSEILAGRRQLMQQFPPPTTGSEQDVSAWANKVLPFMMDKGDFEGVKALQPLADQFAKNLHNRPFEAQLFKSPDGQTMRYFDPSEATQIPQGWTQVPKAGSAGLGTPQLFRGPKGDYVGVAPGDNATLAKLSQQGYKPEITARTEFVQNATQGRFDTADIGKQVASFDKLNVPITKMATMYPGFDAVSKQALAGNPGAFKAFVSQMAAQLDPSLQLRLGTLMFAQNIDPSFTGNLKRYLSEKMNGSLPPDQIRKVIAVVNAVRQEQRDLYEKRRADLVSNFPGADKYAHSVDDVFGAATTPAATGGAGGAGGAGAGAASVAGAKPDVAARDAQLKAQGKAAAERLRTLRAEGYNVR